jgi:hypothetical protein
VKQYREVFCLHQLEAVRNIVFFRDTGRQTARAGMVFAVVINPLVIECARPWLKRHVFRFHVCCEIQQVLYGILRQPEPRQIRLAVRRALCRRIQIHFSVRRPRHTFPRVRIPLRGRNAADGAYQREGGERNEQHVFDCTGHVDESPFLVIGSSGKDGAGVLLTRGKL